ncbi:MAG: amino acid ABC transporter permease [bacterium]|nr:amino acid ABC transporter permease [bacterium]
MEALIAYYDTVFSYMPGYLQATLLVLQITVVITVLSWVIGLATALGNLLKNKYLRAPFAFYVWFIRGTPALIQIFIIYFGLNQLGLRLVAFAAGIIALAVHSGAYVSEVFRSGFLAIPKGQMESAISLGMSRFLAYRRIILPQVVRIILPPLTNHAIDDVKNTALLSTITVMEITMFTQVAVAETFKPFDFYIISAILYLILTTLLTVLSGYLEGLQAKAYITTDSGQP